MGRLPDFSGEGQVYVWKHEQNDQRGCPLEPLSLGDTVRVQRDGCWATKARVQDACSTKVLPGHYRGWS